MSKLIQTRRTRDEWFHLFAAHEACGLRAVDFCANEGLCPKYFSQRRRVLKWRQPRSKGMAALRPASSSPSPAFLSVDVKSSRAFSLSAGGITLTCAADVPTYASGEPTYR